MVEGADAQWASFLIRVCSSGGSARSGGPCPSSFSLELWDTPMDGANGAFCWAPGCSERASPKLPCPWKLSQTWTCFARVRSFFPMLSGALRVCRDSRGWEKENEETEQGNKKEKIKMTELWRKLREEKPHLEGLVLCGGSGFSLGVIISQAGLHLCVSRIINVRQNVNWRIRREHAGLARSGHPWPDRARRLGVQALKRRILGAGVSFLDPECTGIVPRMSQACSLLRRARAVLKECSWVYSGPCLLVAPEERSPFFLGAAWLGVTCSCGTVLPSESTPPGAAGRSSLTGGLTSPKPHR